LQELKLADEILSKINAFKQYYLRKQLWHGHVAYSSVQ